MKICWDNLERLIYNKKTGNFKIGRYIYYVFESCSECGEPFLGATKHDKYCSNKCSSKDKNNPMYGKTHSTESRYKISKNHINVSGENNPFYGKTHPPERMVQIVKNRVDQSGSNNPNWKGGISCEPYCFQWLDKEYKNWLKYERDGGKCQNPQCGHRTTTIHLHHINYIKKDCRPVNLITLCNSCNGKANADREWHESYYNEIMRIKGRCYVSNS